MFNPLNEQCISGSPNLNARELLGFGYPLINMKRTKSMNQCSEIAATRSLFNCSMAMGRPNNTDSEISDTTASIGLDRNTSGRCSRAWGMISSTRHNMRTFLLRKSPRTR